MLLWKLLVVVITEMEMAKLKGIYTGKTVHKYGLNGNTVRVRRSQTDADLHGVQSVNDEYL